MCGFVVVGPCSRGQLILVFPAACTHTTRTRKKLKDSVSRTKYIPPTTKPTVSVEPHNYPQRTKSKQIIKIHPRDLVFGGCRDVPLLPRLRMLGPVLVILWFFLFCFFSVSLLSPKIERTRERERKEGRENERTREKEEGRLVESTS